MTTNRDLAELLARRADDEARGSDRQRALRRASRRALLWPMEATELMPDRFRELAGVGYWIAGLLHEWVDGCIEAPSPPSLREEFMTMTEATEIVDQVRAPQVFGDLQMHTTYSDGHASVEEMATACIEKGYAYMAVTDHAKGLKIANGRDEGSLRGQYGEIGMVERRLNAAGTRFTIFRSVETNLDVHGIPDLDPSFLAETDLVLGAFHSALRKKEDQTERYISALRNGCVDVLAHPRGRIYNFRDGLSADWPEVFAEASKLGVAIEVDCYVDRQDASLRLLSAARESGTWISLGTDAHHPIDLPSMKLGQAAVLKAGIPESKILNFLTADELRDWVTERRRRAGIGKGE